MWTALTTSKVAKFYMLDAVRYNKQLVTRMIYTLEIFFQRQRQWSYGVKCAYHKLQGIFAQTKNSWQKTWSNMDRAEYVIQYVPVPADDDKDDGGDDDENGWHDDQQDQNACEQRQSIVKRHQQVLQQV